MARFYCTVTSCVRTIEGPKTPSSFLVERTCRYAKSGDCNLGYHRAYNKYPINSPSNSSNTPISPINNSFIT